MTLIGRNPATHPHNGWYTCARCGRAVSPVTAQYFHSVGLGSVTHGSADLGPLQSPPPSSALFSPPRHHPQRTPGTVDIEACLHQHATYKSTREILTTHKTTFASTSRLSAALVLSLETQRRLLEKDAAPVTPHISAALPCSSFRSSGSLCMALRGQTSTPTSSMA